jgi:hypothetical protein
LEGCEVSAAAIVTSDHSQDTKRVVAFGGTGKTVALIYRKIGLLLGEDANIVVCDFPASADYNSPDGRLDRDLAAEGVGQQCRINTLPDGIPAVPNTLIETFKLPSSVADALFTKKQQDTPPTEGLNQEPQVGATVAWWKTKRDGDQIRQKCTGEPEIFFVAGLGGGTGTGVTPAFARYLRQFQRNSRMHGVFLLPWQDIGGNIVGNAGQERNAKSLLKYLRDCGEDLFDSLVVIGSPPGVDAYATAAGGKRPIHPTLILAALYIHMWHGYGGGSQLTSKLNKMETVRSGIPLSEISGRSGTLYDMLAHSARVEHLLLDVVGQAPDERIAWFSLFPLSFPLSWDSIEWLMKLYAIHVKASYAVAWLDIRSRLRDLADQENARRSWIVELAKDKSLFQFDENQLDGDARTGYELYREAAVADKSYKKFVFKTLEREAARNEICAFVHAMISDAVLNTMKLARK